MMHFYELLVVTYLFAKISGFIEKDEAKSHFSVLEIPRVMSGTKN